jgi:hypothetical protein
MCFPNSFACLYDPKTDASISWSKSSYGSEQFKGMMGKTLAEAMGLPLLEDKSDDESLQAQVGKEATWYGTDFNQVDKYCMNFFKH